jgi:hypothetical protein
LRLRIDDEAQTMEYELSYDNLEGVGTTPFVTNGVVTAAHIHVSAPGVNGGVATFLCGGGGKPACPTPAGRNLFAAQPRSSVNEFGGGLVPPLNGALTPAPECNPGAVVFLRNGQAQTLTGLDPGLHKFQCCIHPWMRGTVRVE